MTLNETLFNERRGTPIVGIMDAQSMANVQASGLPAAYLNGYDLVRAVLGGTNEGLISPSEIAAQLRHIKEQTSFPVIVDAESGFGNQLTTYFVAQDLERSGAAGIVINDQIFPAHTAQSKTTMIEFSDFVAKLKAARAAFDDSETRLFAELDGGQIYGGEGLLKRIQYIQANELADGVLVGHATTETLAEVAADEYISPVGLVVNQVRDTQLRFDPTEFSTVFYTGKLTEARQVAEQQALQQLMTKVEVAK